MSIKSLVKQSLIGRENRKYHRALEARRMTYARWQTARSGEQVDTLFDLSGYEVLLAEGARLDKPALKRVAKYLEEHPGVQMVYGDEDVSDTGTEECHSPYFKPDWSPDLLESCFYMGSLAVVDKKLLEEVRGTADKVPSPKEELRRRWIKEAAKRAGGYGKRTREERCSGAEPVAHISEILSHCNSVEMMEEYTCQKMTIVSERRADKLISVVIPSKDHPELLEKCIRSLGKAAADTKYEILVIDNGSTPENRGACEQFLGAFDKEGVKVRYFYRPMEFDFAAMCNLGAEYAEGKLLLFLNDDVEMVCPGTLENMADKALKEYVGAVGLKLLYPDGERIQHAGITNLPMGPVHKLQFMSDKETHIYHTNRGCRNVIAVTGACLMVEKDKFQEAGGFPGKLPVAFNDVALCFGLYEAGYYNVVINELYAYHHESLSRGDDESEEKMSRLIGEKDTLYSLFPAMKGRDPYYNVNLDRVFLDTRIRCGYETAGNSPQTMEVTIGKAPEGYRQDACLLLRVEDCNEERITGYSVVLGDDNSCYEREMLLYPISEEGKDSADEPVYRMIPEGQYRPDLEENMPDQTNVGLCGFWIKPLLPAGSYRIGMAVRNRVTGTKLINYSNRILRMPETEGRM